MAQRGMIFDMDNTLLQSNINFQAMRQDLVEYMLEHQLGCEQAYEQCDTPAEVIEYGKSLMKKVPSQSAVNKEQEIWQIVKEHEKMGMRNVQLEEGAFQAIQAYHQQGMVLAVVTNNAYESACDALNHVQIAPFFNLIVGRDQMKELKPSASGVHLVLDTFPQVNEWVMIGDSWIDGRAALDAKVPFIAYQGDKTAMKREGVVLAGEVQSYTELNLWIEDWSVNRAD